MGKETNWEANAGKTVTLEDMNKWVEEVEYDTLAERDAASTGYGSLDVGRQCRVLETGHKYSWNGAVWEQLGGVTGGAGAPPSDPFVTYAASANLSAEKEHKDLAGAELHTPKAHTHLEAEITDLDHDAQKIKGKTVDDTAIANDKALVYKTASGNIEYSTVSTVPHDMGGASHNPDTIANLNTKISDATVDDVSGTRDPNAHAATHQNAGGDEIDVTGLSGVLADDQDADHIVGVEVDDSAKANNMVLGYQVASGKIEYIAAPAPGAHAASHQNAGGDEINVAGLSGELADNQPPKAHKDTHKTAGSDAFTAADLIDGIARTTARKNTGANVGSRRRFNFIEGAGIALTLTDDAANEEVDINIVHEDWIHAGGYKMTTRWFAWEAGETVIKTFSVLGSCHFHYESRTPTVGGISIPINKLSLLAPYIALVATIILAASISVAIIKYRKKQ